MASGSSLKILVLALLFTAELEIVGAGGGGGHAQGGGGGQGDLSLDTRHSPKLVQYLSRYTPQRVKRMDMLERVALREMLVEMGLDLKTAEQHSICQVGAHEWDCKQDTADSAPSGINPLPTREGKYTVANRLQDLIKQVTEANEAELAKIDQTIIPGSIEALQSAAGVRIVVQSSDDMDKSTLIFVIVISVMTSLIVLTGTLGGGLARIFSPGTDLSHHAKKMEQKGKADKEENNDSILRSFRKQEEARKIDRENVKRIFEVARDVWGGLMPSIAKPYPGMKDKSKVCIDGYRPDYPFCALTKTFVEKKALSEAEVATLSELCEVSSHGRCKLVDSKLPSLPVCSPISDSCIVQEVSDRGTLMPVTQEYCARLSATECAADQERSCILQRSFKCRAAPANWCTQYGASCPAAEGCVVKDDSCLNKYSPGDVWEYLKPLIEAAISAHIADIPDEKEQIEQWQAKCVAADRDVAAQTLVEQACRAIKAEEDCFNFQKIEGEDFVCDYVNGNESVEHFKADVLKVVQFMYFADLVDDKAPNRVRWKDLQASFLSTLPAIDPAEVRNNMCHTTFQATDFEKWLAETKSIKERKPHGAMCEELEKMLAGKDVASVAKPDPESDNERKAARALRRRFGDWVACEIYLLEAVVKEKELTKDKEKHFMQDMMGCFASTHNYDMDKVLGELNKFATHPGGTCEKKVVTEESKCATWIDLVMQPHDVEKAKDDAISTVELRDYSASKTAFMDKCTGERNCAYIPTEVPGLIEWLEAARKAKNGAGANEKEKERKAYRDWTKDCKVPAPGDCAEVMEGKAYVVNPEDDGVCADHRLQAIECNHSLKIIDSSPDYLETTKGTGSAITNMRAACRPADSDNCADQSDYYLGRRYIADDDDKWLKAWFEPYGIKIKGVLRPT